MTEEMVGEQHHSDESTQIRAHRVNTNATIVFVTNYGTGVPERGQHTRKNHLQRPTSLEKALWA
jgi:hypothetical protein